MKKFQKNVYVLTGAEFIAVGGFSVIVPFLPFYIQDLGVTDPVQVKLWSGWLFSSTAITMALVAPVWGSLADRYGRKLMLGRAMFGGAIVFLLMGLARSVEQVLILRALQGLLTGTVPAATALIASTSPSHRSGYSIGLLQTGIYLGASLGPLAGGVLADAFGYRSAFWVTSASLLMAGIAVHYMVEDSSGEQKEAEETVVKNQSFDLSIFYSVSLLPIIFLIRFSTRIGNRIVGPMLPLFVQELSPGVITIATTSGLIMGVGALASAIGALWLGRTSDRMGYRKMLILCTFGLMIFSFPQAFVTSILQLVVLQFVVGFLMAGVFSSISALMAKMVPKERIGLLYGFDTTVVASANAIAPMLGAWAGILWGLRSIFVVTAFFFLIGSVLSSWLYLRKE